MPSPPPPRTLWYIVETAWLVRKSVQDDTQLLVGTHLFKATTIGACKRKIVAPARSNERRRWACCNNRMKGHAIHPHVRTTRKGVDGGQNHTYCCPLRPIRRGPSHQDTLSTIIAATLLMACSHLDASVSDDVVFAEIAHSRRNDCHQDIFPRSRTLMHMCLLWSG
jgi:hypothetical protein